MAASEPATTTPTSDATPATFLDLPAELRLSIVSEMKDVETRISTALALYLHLWSRRVMPTITPTTFHFLFRGPVGLGDSQPVVLPRTRFGGLPPELVLMMLRGLPWHEMMNVVFADYHRFRAMGIAPGLEAGTRAQLVCVLVRSGQQLRV